MITPDDFLVLDYQDDYTRAGVSYVVRWLGRPTRPDELNYDRLRETVAQKAVELAFRRPLGQEDVPHTLTDSTSFEDADILDIQLGGRRCHVFSALVSGRKDIARFREHPARYLGASALVPSEWHRQQQTSDEDLYLFAFLSGLVTRSQASLSRAIEAGQPLALTFPMPSDWYHGREWRSLGQLAVKADTSKEIEVTLGGLDEERAYQSVALSVPPRQRVAVGEDFYGLNVLQSSGLPDGPLGVHSKALDETLLVASHQWVNLWVYGLQIAFVGYITRGEFGRSARHLQASSRVLGVPALHEEMLSIRVNQLQPIPDLFVRARNWEASR